MKQIPALVLVFSYLSLLTIGGGMAAFPELQHLTVDVHHWLTPEQLVHFYSVGQLAPGPNMMMVAAVGQRVAGVFGSLAVVAAFFLPSGLITFGVGRLWKRLETWPWRTSIQRGLAPVSVGLLLAGSITMMKIAITGPITLITSVVVLALLLRTKINPALLILGGAVVGFAFKLGQG